MPAPSVLPEVLVDNLLVVSLVSGASLASASISAVAAWALTRPGVRSLRGQVSHLEAEAAGLRDEVRTLAPFREVRDAADEAARLRKGATEEIQREVSAARERAAALVTRGEQDAARVIAEATQTANRMRADAAADVERAKGESARARDAAKERARVAGEEAQRVVDDAYLRARSITSAAERQAQETAGAALEAMRDADRWTQTVRAMKNLVEGYGDRYVVATHSFLDGLAEDFGFAEAGQQLKRTREVSRALVKEGRAATCDYVEAVRRDTAVRFVVDAFNGKVDSILTQVKEDHVGTLAQQIRDAFNLSALAEA